MRHILSPKSALAALIATGLSLHTAVAEPKSDRFPINLEEISAKAEKRFANADQDGSGTIDLAEFESAKRMQHGAHGQQGARNKGGAKRWKQHHRQNNPELREQVRAELFAMLDANADGQISENEFAQHDRDSMRRAMRRAMFKQLDTDQDQLISADEMPNPAKALRVADTNGDGLVTKREMRASRKQVREARQAG